MSEADQVARPTSLSFLSGSEIWIWIFSPEGVVKISKPRVGELIGSRG